MKLWRGTATIYNVWLSEQFIMFTVAARFCAARQCSMCRVTNGEDRDSHHSSSVNKHHGKLSNILIWTVEVLTGAGGGWCYLVDPSSVSAFPRKRTVANGQAGL